MPTAYKDKKIIDAMIRGLHAAISDTELWSTNNGGYNV